MASATLGAPYVVSEEGAKTLADMASKKPARRMEGFVSRRATTERLNSLSDRVAGSGNQSRR